MIQIYFQVFPNVLWVCELGLCPADIGKDTKLETKVQILPLVCGFICLVLRGLDTLAAYAFLSKC